jgi:hypothetical protein
MMRREMLLGTAALAAAVAGLAWVAGPDRTAPTSVVLGYYQCDRSEVGKVDAFMAEVQAPLMDEVVRQGLWIRWSYLTHRYGDEWNRVIVYEAPDLETHLRASAEFTRRLAQAHSGPNPFVQFCDAHKDNLYTRTLP